ncbi:MAG TPA: hypothetical protein PLB62_01720 [Candidatus Sumerlaeota bacterium]|nr:hypothetical protein [Candidatus Sumerlaeota bacterium]
MVTGKLILILSVLCLAVLLTGCIGIYNNQDNFLNPPETGAPEINMLNSLGAPQFSTTVEDQKVYVYRVRNVKYIVLVGLYEGYDLVVICRDGMVVQTKRVPRPKAFTLFNPLPWAVAD